MKDSIDNYSTSYFGYTRDTLTLRKHKCEIIKGSYTKSTYVQHSTQSFLRIHRVNMDMYLQTLIKVTPVEGEGHGHRQKL